MRVAYITPKHDDQQILKVKYAPNKPIKNLKKNIKKEYGIPEYCQKLYIGENEILDDKLLSYYGGGEKLFLYNMHELRTLVSLKHKPIEYFLKGCDSIFNLKENILKDFNIPINKIIIYNSNNIVNDNQLFEEFLLNLNFEIKLLDTDKIKINLIDENENNINTIIIDPFSYTNDIYSKVNLNYDFKLRFNGEFIDSGKLISQYNIQNGDNVDIIRCNSNKIELEVKLGINETKNVIVFPHEPLYRLLDLLKLTDKTINFVYDDNVYSIGSIQTFEEIGLTTNSKINIIN